MCLYINTHLRSMSMYFLIDTKVWRSDKENPESLILIGSNSFYIDQQGIKRLNSIRKNKYVFFFNINV